MERKYDLYSAEFRKHEHEIYSRMRSTEPVFQQPGLDGVTPIWFVTGYAEVERVLTDDRGFTRDFQTVMTPEQLQEFEKGSDPQVVSMISNHMLNKDGDTHRRLRSLVSKAFTPRVIQDLRPRIELIAKELLDAVAARGNMELVSEFAFPLPIMVITELLGIPLDYREQFRTWSNAVVAPAITPEAQQESLRLLLEFVDYMKTLVGLRRQYPGSDLLSGLIHAEEAGDRLSESELFSMLSLLIVAGHETTVTLLGNAVLALIQNPDQLELLQQNAGLINRAVEELVRFDAPVDRALTRWVVQDTELGSMQLRRGEPIIVILGAANRDESRFTCPTELDLKRKTNPHLGFGKGPHYCLGAPLARLEAEIALKFLFQRFPDLRLDIPLEELAWREVPLFRSLVRLPVRWTPG